MRHAILAFGALLILVQPAAAQSSFYTAICEPLPPLFLEQPTIGWTVETGGAPGVIAGVLRVDGPVKSICGYWWNDAIPPVRTLCESSPAGDRKWTGSRGPDVAVSLSRQLADGTWQWCVMGPVQVTPLFVGPAKKVR